MKRFGSFALIFVTCALLCVVFPASELGQSSSRVSQLYSKRDVMIPMRDGVRLHTEIYVPKNSAAAAAVHVRRALLTAQTTIETASPANFPSTRR